MRIPPPNRRARLPNMAVSRGNEFRSSRRSPTSTFWSSNAIIPLHLQEGRADQPAVLYHGDSMSGYKGWRNFGERRYWVLRRITRVKVLYRKRPSLLKNPSTPRSEAQN